MKNEARWARRVIERTWEVCASVGIWDDGSTDGTAEEYIASLGISAETRETPWGTVSTSPGKKLYIWRSPFARDDVRPAERANEIRDRNALYGLMKSNVPFEHVLCLDGDEWLSLEAIRLWPRIVSAMDATADFVQLPFVYLWDGEDQQRIDGIYGPAMDGDRACMTCATVDCASPRHKRLRFPRAFTVNRLTAEELFNTRVEWNGTKAGLHCGSLPQTGFTPSGCAPIVTYAEAPIVHAGYMDSDLRQKKVDFYRRLDPPGTESNRFEDNYLHCEGKPNRHAPGPVRLAPFEDV